MKKRYYIVLIAVFVILVLVSPVMNVKTVSVTGNKNISETEILNLSGYADNTNLLFFPEQDAKRKLAENTYIKSVDIKKDFLKRELIFVVSERVLSGFVKFREGSYLYIDREGVVLECKSSCSGKLPVIEGLEFSEFSVGDYLKVDNSAAFDTMVLLSNLFSKFEIEHDIVSVDISDEDDLHFYYGKIDILLGNASNLDLKVSAIKQILPELDDKKDMGGFLHIQDINNMRLSLLN